LSADCDLFGEVASVGGEKPVGSGFERGDQYRNIGLVPDQLAVAIDLP